jgi:plasmid stabilization system protein ParE
MTILWTEHALACLVEIEDFIAQDDPVAAVLLVENLITRIDILKDHPLAGCRVPEVPKSRLRELVEENYRIVYRVRADSIEILTVFESHRLYRGFEG